MVVAELGVVEKQQQGSQPAAWADEDDDTGGEQPKSSPPRGALSGTPLTFSCRAVIHGIHRQAANAQRGRTFQTVAQEVENRRVGGLVVDWGSASSRGLGRSMDGGEGAVRYESVYVRKRRPSPAARAHAQKGT